MTTQIQTNLHINYISEDTIYLLADKPHLFPVWTVLRHEYRKHKAASRASGTNDVLKCYFCHNDFLAEKCGKSKRNIEKNIQELTEMGLLLSIIHTSRSGNVVKSKAFRIPLDPQDSDYKMTVNMFNKYMNKSDTEEKAEVKEEVKKPTDKSKRLNREEIKPQYNHDVDALTTKLMNIVKSATKNEDKIKSTDSWILKIKASPNLNYFNEYDILNRVFTELNMGYLKARI